jgi:hypothetical protein
LIANRSLCGFGCIGVLPKADETTKQLHETYTPVPSGKIFAVAVSIDSDKPGGKTS